MKFVIGDQQCAIYGDYPRGNLELELSFFQTGAFFSPAYKNGHWDGRVRLLKWVKAKKCDTFPTGLLSRAWPLISIFNPEVVDERTKVTATPNYDLGVYDIQSEKFGYQGDALKAMISHGRGVIAIPTGGGKTVVGGAAIKSFDTQTIWLTDRQALAKQARESIEAVTGETVGLIGDGVRDLQRVTVAMVQSCTAAIDRKDEEVQDWLKGCQLIIGDEIHHAESKSWYSLLEFIPAPYRFGLSATANLEDEGMFIQAQTGPIIYRISMTELAARGVVVPPRIWCVKYKTEKIPAKTAFQTAYKDGIVHNSYRNEKIVEVAKCFHKEKKPTLILVNRINHGEMLCDELSAAGLEYGWIEGKVSQTNRDELIRQMCNAEIPGIVAVASTMGEGVDIPELRAVINATGTKGGQSKDDEIGRLTVQILGRGLRSVKPSSLFGEKKHFDYVDFVDMNHRFLKNASKARVETLEYEGYSGSIKYWDEYTRS